jgi:hypothetical protein
MAARIFPKMLSLLSPLFICPHFGDFSMEARQTATALRMSACRARCAHSRYRLRTNPKTHGATDRDALRQSEGDLQVSLPTAERDSSGVRRSPGMQSDVELILIVVLVVITSRQRRNGQPQGDLGRDALYWAVSTAARAHACFSAGNLSTLAGAINAARTSCLHIETRISGRQ